MAYHRNIKFKRNYGGKLYGSNFSTLQQYDSKKWVMNHVYEVWLEGEYLGTAQLMYIRSTRKSAINGFVAILDANCTVGQCQSMIDRRFPSQSDQHLAYLCFKWIRKDKGCSVDVKGLKARLKKMESDGPAAT